jgi:hypothetical protein
MERYRTMAPYLLPFVCVAALVCVAAQNKESGNDPYTPTKLEWLCTYINSTFRVDHSGGYQLTAHYSKPDTIVLLYYMPPDGDRQFVNTTLQEFREVVELEAKHRGWDRWLTIREQVSIAGAGKNTAAE